MAGAELLLQAHPSTQGPSSPPHHPTRPTPPHPARAPDCPSSPSYTAAAAASCTTAAAAAAAAMERASDLPMVRGVSVAIWCRWGGMGRGGAVIQQQRAMLCAGLRTLLRPPPSPPLAPALSHRRVLLLLPDHLLLTLQQLQAPLVSLSHVGAARTHATRGVRGWGG